jgi:hypothetical protein
VKSTHELQLYGRSVSTLVNRFIHLRFVRRSRKYGKDEKEKTHHALVQPLNVFKVALFNGVGLYAPLKCGFFFWECVLIDASRPTTLFKKQVPSNYAQDMLIITVFVTPGHITLGYAGVGYSTWHSSVHSTRRLSLSPTSGFGSKIAAFWQQKYLHIEKSVFPCCSFVKGCFPIERE